MTQKKRQRKQKKRPPPLPPHPTYIKRFRKLTTPHPARGGAAGGGVIGGGAAGGGAVGCGGAGGEAAGARAGRACARIYYYYYYHYLIYNYVGRFIRRHGSGQYVLVAMRQHPDKPTYRTSTVLSMSRTSRHIPDDLDSHVDLIVTPRMALERSSERASAAAAATRTQTHPHSLCGTCGPKTTSNFPIGRCGSQPAKTR